MTDISWIADENLAVVFSRLAAIQRRPQALSGHFIAPLLWRLIQAESQPGGPYLNAAGDVDPILNAQIDTVLRELDVWLPNLAPYRSIDVQQQALPTKEQMSNLSTTLRSRLSRHRKTIRTSHHGPEIAGINKAFAASLRESHVNAMQLKLLARANLNAWVAYTIYDDFYDDEGDPQLLPLAHYAARESIKAYKAAWDTSASRTLIETIFEQMDTANLWEMSNARAGVNDKHLTFTRLPDYKQNTVLAARASAHILGPLLIAHNNASVSQKQFDKIQEGLNQYLILRQLNDDLHDWPQDLRAGHLSPVVTYLLRQNGIVPGRYKLANLEQQLRQAFWDNGLHNLCKQTLRHAVRCQQAFKDSDVVEMDGDFMAFISNLEAAITAGLRQHKSDKDFVHSYQYLTKDSPA